MGLLLSNVNANGDSMADPVKPTLMIAKRLNVLMVGPVKMELLPLPVNADLVLQEGFAKQI